MNEYDLVKDSVTVPMALNKYAEWNGRKRCRCPIHGGSGNNFSVLDKSWYCFSKCCKGGDVILLVAELFRESSRQALSRIKNDFLVDTSLAKIETKSEYDKRKSEEAFKKKVVSRARRILSEFMHWHNYVVESIANENDLDRSDVESVLSYFSYVDYLYDSMPVKTSDAYDFCMIYKDMIGKLAKMKEVSISDGSEQA